LEAVFCTQSVPKLYMEAQQDQESWVVRQKVRSWVSRGQKPSWLCSPSQQQITRLGQDLWKYVNKIVSLSFICSSFAQS
jgi:hypothetical protein